MSQIGMNPGKMPLDDAQLCDASAPSERMGESILHRRTQSAPANTTNIISNEQLGSAHDLSGQLDVLLGAPDANMLRSRQKGVPSGMGDPKPGRNELPGQSGREKTPEAHPSEEPKDEPVHIPVEKEGEQHPGSDGGKVCIHSMAEQEVPIEEEDLEEASDSGIRQSSDLDATRRKDSAGAPGSLNSGPVVDRDVSSRLYVDGNRVEDAATAAIREINDKIPSAQGRSKLYKAFRILGQIASLVAGAAAITVGVLTANPLLIIGGSIGAFKGFFDFLGECSDGKLTIESGVQCVAKFFGASDKAAAWIGFGVGFSLSLASTVTSLMGGINAIGVADNLSKAISDFQNFSLVASKAATLINTTIALADPNAAVAAEQTQLSDDEVDMLAAQLRDIEDEGERLEALRTLAKLAARYKNEAPEGVDSNLLRALCKEARAMHSGGVPQGFDEEDLQAPGGEDIRQSGLNGTRAGGIDQNQVADIAAQKKRVTRASRFFKALGGAALTAGGVLLTIAAIQTGGAGSTKNILAGGAAALKGAYTMVDGVVGMVSSKNEGLLKSLGMKNSGLIATIEAILPLADVVLDGMAKGVNFNTDWESLGRTKGDISAQVLSEFPNLETDAALSAVDPMKHLVTIAEAQAVLASYHADVDLSEGMRNCIYVP